MRILSAIGYDIKFQIRYGFYYAYILVSALYILLLRVLPSDIRQYIAVLVIFTDPAALGFFFIGGIVLLEKSQNIFESLFVTPFKTSEYLISKVISLSLLSVLSSIVIVIAGTGMKFNIAALIIGVMLSSIFFTMLGFTLAFRARTLNQYLIMSVIYEPILMLPLLEYLKIVKSIFFSVLPAKPSLVLLKGIYEHLSAADYLYSIAVLMIWIIIAYIWAHSWFDKYIIRRIGGSGK